MKNTADKITILSDLFVNKDLFDQALTHKSWVNEHKGLRKSNERMEFLGDAVLEFVVSRELFEKFPEKEEGFLTALRANIVNTVSLAKLAVDLKLGDNIFLSKGEEESGGRENASLLADTLEAIIGAIYLDAGLSKAEEFIKENLLNDLGKRIEKPLKDSKSLLQEYVQSKSLPTPRYKVVQALGPDHNKRFIIDAYIGNDVWGRGEGKSKAIAEKEAAKQAMEHKGKKSFAISPRDGKISK